MKTTPKPSQIVIMASGAVMFIFGFLPWYKFASVSRNAWSTGMFPLATAVPVFGLISGGVMAAAVFGNVQLPEPILSFTWRQIHFILAFTALVIAGGFLLLDNGGFDKGAGFWLCLLGAIGLIVGTVMELLEGGAAIPGRSSAGPNTPF